jgi:glucose/arabinose dehydrogenase
MAFGAVFVATSGGCFKARPSKGGGQIDRGDVVEAARRAPNPFDIDVPAGYRIELVTDKLTFPTGVAFGRGGEVFVVESGYAYGEKFGSARVVRVERDGSQRELVSSTRGVPWNGIAVHDNALFIAEGGEVDGGRIVRYAIDGDKLGAPTILADKLPSTGDHHTNGPVVSPDGWVYFGQGTVTNAAVVGPDNFEFGWLPRHPELHDTPCKDVTVVGTGFASKNPLTPADDEVTTGAYQPFGTPGTPQQVIKGAVPCNGAVMRVRATGGDVELVAWGFRNPYGLALDGSGQLFVTDNGFDTRGSRPVFGAADVLWKVMPGSWYGWPDFAEGRPLTAGWYSEDKGATKGFVLGAHPQTPPEPAIYFAVHSSATGLDFSRSDSFGHVGHGFVALFGDMAPKVGKVLHPVGFAVMRVDPRTGELDYFARNRPDRPGPASKQDTRGLERPIAARFSPDGSSLYVVDFGVLRVSDKGPEAIENTGKLWRIMKESTHAAP